MIGERAVCYPRLRRRSAKPPTARTDSVPGLPRRNGVRIEDMVVVTPGGCENITSTGRERTIIG